jgi:phage tail-like protein
MMTVIENIVSSPSPNGATGDQSQLEGGHAACRFYVQIGDGAQQNQALFTEVSGLQVEMQTMDYQEGGTNTFVHRLPGPLKIGNITLKHGLTRSNEFLQWCLSVPPHLHRRNVTVVMYDAEGSWVARWHFRNAYPVKWVGPSFTADSTAMAIESIEVAHQGLTVEPAS